MLKLQPLQEFVHNYNYYIEVASSPGSLPLLLLALRFFILILTPTYHTQLRPHIVMQSSVCFRVTH